MLRNWIKKRKPLKAAKLKIILIASISLAESRGQYGFKNKT